MANKNYIDVKSSITYYYSFDQILENSTKEQRERINKNYFKLGSEIDDVYDILSEYCQDHELNISSEFSNAVKEHSVMKSYNYVNIPDAYVNFFYV